MLVVATNGEYGEAPDDLADGETLVDRRRAETERSATVLGVHRVVWLGLPRQRDDRLGAEPRSGLVPPGRRRRRRGAAGGDPRRGGRRRRSLSYDWHGNYGHPDHVKAHRVAHRAASIAGTSRVLDATMNRDEMVRWFEAQGMEPDWDPRKPMDDGNPLGSAQDEITLRVDVSAYVAQKRASILCHASQVSDTGQFREMDETAFAIAFASEWFVEADAPPGLRDGFLIA